MALTKITSKVVSEEFSSSTPLISAATVDIDWAANDPILLTTPERLDKKLIELSQDLVDSNFPWS
jgi:hypothetical protein